jgi:hypothetical protein
MRPEILLVVACLTCAGCRGEGKDAGAGAEPVEIHRFDKALFRLIEAGNDVGIQGELLCDYPEMMEVTGKDILNMQSSATPGFFDRLVGYYSEPTLQGLYRDALAAYDSVTDLAKTLGSAFAYLGENLPAMPLPRVYMHVSGLRQNVWVAENLLSLSIDKYLGKDYPLYREFFYEYQREKMQPCRMAPDYLTGWLMAEYPFAGNEDVLLERMIYEGKIKYIVSEALPELPLPTLMGFTQSACAWCEKNEGELWKTIVERKHLYTPDLSTTDKYLRETPATFLSGEAPGHVGLWIGLQIVRRYMKQTGLGLERLMRENNAQEILTRSGYKPF